MHAVPLGQTLPQLPQFSASLSKSTQPPKQQPGVVPFSQAFPQKPQFCASPSRSTQPAPQHAPVEQSRPQPPQLLGFVVGVGAVAVAAGVAGVAGVVAAAAVGLVRVLVDARAAAAALARLAGVAAQPQLRSSSLVSTQVPLQRLKLPQSVVQWPFEHTSLPVQTLPQPPQLGCRS